MVFYSEVTNLADAEKKMKHDVQRNVESIII